MLSLTSRTRSRSNPSSMGRATNPTRLGLLPENVLFNVAGYLDPPDLYLFNQLFPEITEPIASVLSGHNILTLNNSEYYPQKPDLVDPEGFLHTVNAATHLSIGDCCMGESHARSLVRVLNVTSPSVFTFEKTKQLAAAMRDINNLRQRSPYRPKVLLSGSVSLQAVLGRIFYTKKGRTTSDVDLFVTRDALPEVRKIMVALGLRCHQVSNRYGFAAFGPQLIDHVEAYVVDVDPNGDQAPYVTASSLAKDHSRRMERILRPGISYKNRLRNSAVHGVGIVRPGHEDEDFYRFPPDYPFTLDADFHNKKVVEVIVAKDSHYPQDIIAHFDIEACKVSFDGEKFGNMNDSIYLNKSDWNRDWDPWINYYIQRCVPEVSDISRQTSPKGNLDKARLFLEDSFFESDDKKLLWVMNAFSQAHLSNIQCKIPCIEHGFNNCECTLVSQTSSHFFGSFHHKVVKQLLRGLKYIDREINIHISKEHIKAFLGEDALQKLTRRNARMTLIARQLKTIKQERERGRIRMKRAKRALAEKIEARAKDREASAQKRAKMSPAEMDEARAKDREAKAKKRAKMSPKMSPFSRKRAKIPDLVEAWLKKEAEASSVKATTKKTKTRNI